MCKRCVLVLVLSCTGLAPTWAQGTPEELAGRARDVLMKHCFDCHGQNPKKLKGSLNLFDRADLSDPERKIVVAAKPDDSELISQVDKDRMPPGNRPKLSAAEKKVLRDWVLAGGPAFPKDGVGADKIATAANQAVRLKELSRLRHWSRQMLYVPDEDQAARVKEIFRLRCLECHGGTTTQAGVKIMDHQRLLVKKRVIPGAPDDSTVFQLITATDSSIMPPPGQPRLSQDEIDTVRQWIADGAAPFPEDVKVPQEAKRDAAFKDVMGVDYVHKQILKHVRGLSERDRKFKRYFSINHVLTAGATAEELTKQREALALALNHLSWEQQIVRPTAIDAPTDSVFCIDLRDLGWQQQPFQRAGGGDNGGRSDLNLFDLALLEYPYGLLYEDSDTFDRLIEEFLIPTAQVRPIIYLRADWFVSVLTQPPFYEDFLRLPFDVKELEDKLGVDAEANLRNGLARRAGLTVSGVSRNNRVVERHKGSNTAYYWKSFDFRTNKGAENMFRDPIELHPTGGEMIFSLPNGLQGYFLANGHSVRVETAPTDIVTDKFAEDRAVRNGLACMRCHVQGMKEFTDTVRPALLRLPGSPGFDKRTALELYPEQAAMDQLLKDDGDRFVKALTAALGRPPLRQGQAPASPLVPVARRFLDEALHLNTVTGELGLVEPAGLESLFRTPDFGGLGLVPLATRGGLVRRDAWEEYFDQVARGLGLGIPVVPLDGLSRRDYPAGSLPFDVELKTNKKHNTFEPGDELVVFVTNRSDKALYVELFGTSARGRAVLLVPSTTRLGPNETCRYPAQGGLKIRGGLGREQIVLYASEAAFAAGEVLRGQGVSDRIVHSFYQYQRQGDRWRVQFNPTRFVKRTIDIETR